MTTHRDSVRSIQWPRTTNSIKLIYWCTVNSCFLWDRQKEQMWTLWQISLWPGLSSRLQMLHDVFYLEYAKGNENLCSQRLFMWRSSRYSVLNSTQTSLCNCNDSLNKKDKMCNFPSAPQVCIALCWSSSKIIPFQYVAGYGCAYQNIRKINGTDALARHGSRLIYF